jgi:hypothetical protein
LLSAAGLRCNDIPCALECSEKVGFAELCGAAEFGTPSNPPKKYRSRRETGRMYKGVFSSNSCTVGLGQTGPIDMSFDGIDSGSNHVVLVGRYVVTPVPGTTNARIQVQVDSCVVNGSDYPYGLIWFSGLGPQLSPGSDIIWPGAWPSSSTTFHCNLKLGSNRPFEGTQCGFRDIIQGGSYPVDSIRDDWDLSQQYADPCALVQTDNSVRHSHAGWPFPLDSGGDVVIGEPSSSAYGASHVSETTTKTKKDIVGLEACVLVGSTWVKHQGHVTDELTIEDTDDAALARAEAAMGWSTPLQNCGSDPAYMTQRGATDFTFAFRSVRVRTVVSRLIPGRLYTVTFKFYRRVVASGLPFTLYAQAPLQFLATAETYRTEWVDVPNEPGFETQAGGCSVAAVPV